MIVENKQNWVYAVNIPPVYSAEVRVTGGSFESCRLRRVPVMMSHSAPVHTGPGGPTKAHNGYRVSFPRG